MAQECAPDKDTIGDKINRRGMGKRGATTRRRPSTSSDTSLTEQSSSHHQTVMNKSRSPKSRSKSCDPNSFRARGSENKDPRSSTMDNGGSCDQSVSSKSSSKHSRRSSVSPKSPSKNRRLSTSSRDSASVASVESNRSTRKKADKSGKKSGKSRTGQTLASLPEASSFPLEERGFVEDDEMNNSVHDFESKEAKKNEEGRTKPTKWPSSGDLAELVSQADLSEAPRPNPNKASRRKSNASMPSKTPRSPDVKGKKKSSGGTKKKKSSCDGTVVSAPGDMLRSKESKEKSLSSSPSEAADRFEASFGVTPAFPTAFAAFTTTSNTQNSKCRSPDKKPLTKPAEQPELAAFDDFYPKSSPGGGGGGGNDDHDMGMSSPNKTKKNGRYTKGKSGPILRNLFGGGKRRKRKEELNYLDDEDDDGGLLLGNQFS